MIGLLLMALLGTDPAPRGDALVTDIVASAEAEWAGAFAASGIAYRPLRVVIVDPPRGHPASGSGYDAGLLVVDRGEIGDILAVFRGEGEALAALVVAHEVGHHVQTQLEAASDGDRATGQARELQADCAAGWWLARANARSVRVTGQARFAVPDLRRAVPQLLSALAMLDGKVTTRGVPADTIGHGSAQQRADAMLQGLASSSPLECGLAIGVTG